MMSVERAIRNYIERSNPKKRTNRKIHNSSPEREVVKQILKWCKDHDFFVFVVESKATYNPQVGTYIHGQSKAGTPDIIGVTPQGYGCFIEVKAKGKRSTLKPHQKQFLLDVVNKDAFACCSDSIAHVEKTYNNWLNSVNKKQFLVNNLPTLAVEKNIDQPLFD